MKSNHRVVRFECRDAQGGLKWVEESSNVTLTKVGDVTVENVLFSKPYTLLDGDVITRVATYWKSK